jgi:hypothetical protein
LDPKIRCKRRNNLGKYLRDYLNEYGFKIYATKEEDTFQVIGIKQDCKTINVSNEWIMKDWKFTIDKNGEII